MDADFTAQRIDRLIVILLEIDHAVHAEARNAAAGFGIERDHAISLSEVDDPFVVARRPIRQPAAGKTPGRDLRALPFVFPMDPQLFTGGRVESDHVAAVPRLWST